VLIGLLDLRISVTLLVVVALIPVSMLFYFLDRHWYHRLLQGAVVQGTKIEQMYAKKLPEIQLGLEISKTSPVIFGGIWKWIFFLFVMTDLRMNRGSTRIRRSRYYTNR